MENWYEHVKAAIVKEAMALNATYEAMLIRASNTVQAKDMSTAFSGMFQPGLTCEHVSQGFHNISFLA
jgi:hypothetical protein